MSLAVGLAIVLSGWLAARGVAAGVREERLREAGAPARGRSPRPVRMPAGLGRVAIVVGAAGAGAGLGLALAGPVGAIAGGVAGWLGVRARASRRLARIAQADEEAFADVAVALATASRAGLSLRQAIAEAASEATPSLRRRIDDTLALLEVGEPLGRALVPISSASRDAALLVGVLETHARIGGELPAVLDRVADLVSERTRARRRLSALTAQGRASGAVLTVLPVAFVGLLSGTGGGGLGAFYRTTLGAGLLAAGLALEGLGFLWIRRILGAAS